MRYQRIGTRGPSASVVGLGASHFGRVCDRQQSRAVVDAALDAGINFIDTAEAYPGSEELLGYALQGRRQHVLVASKFGHPANHPTGRRATRQVIQASIEGTLRRLQTDYLDLYLMHMPDPRTPIAETLAGLDELVRSGLVRFVGASNLDAAQIAEAQSVAHALPMRQMVCVQNRYNLLDRDVERDVIPVCQSQGLGLVPHTPLASGLLTGRLRRGDPLIPGTRLADKHTTISDETFDAVERFECFAQQRGISMVSLAVGWLAAQPCVGPVITGATTPEQIRANAAAGEWIPSPDDVIALGEFNLA